MQEKPHILASTIKDGHGVNQTYNLNNWKSAYGKDQFSTEMPTNGSVLFDYNATAEVKKVVLNQTYVDLHHNVYRGVVTLNPYSSIILIPNTDKVLDVAANPKSMLSTASVNNAK